VIDSQTLFLSLAGASFVLGLATLLWPQGAPKVRLSISHDPNDLDAPSGLTKAQERAIQAILRRGHKIGLGNATLWCASDGDKILVMTSNREVLESLSTVLQDAVEASTDTEPISSDSSATEEATRE
jgi:hypothetical protein